MIRFLNRLSQIRRRYSQRPFWFRTEFQKGHCFCYCVFRKLSYVNQPEFLWRSSHRNSGFFYFQKGRLPFGALFQPFSCFGDSGCSAPLLPACCPFPGELPPKPGLHIFLFPFGVQIFNGNLCSRIVQSAFPGVLRLYRESAGNGCGRSGH